MCATSDAKSQTKAQKETKMSNVISAVDFFRDTLKQDVITLSMHSGQAEIITLEALDGFVVQAAAKGLLVEVWIEGERRDYEFGDYVKLLQREVHRVEENPYLDGGNWRLLGERPDSVKESKESKDTKATKLKGKNWSDDGTPKG